MLTCNPLRNSAGTALLTALFIMTLIAITTTAMIKRLHIEIARTQRYIETDQFYLAAQLVQFWSLSTLSLEGSTPPLTGPHGKIFSFPASKQNLYPGFVVKGNIYDLQSRFNLNNLTAPSMQAVFLRFIQQIEPTTSTPFIQSLIAATLDWISPSVINNQNKWTQYYASLSHPYLPAHQPMQSVFEFNRVAGVTPALFEKLLPYIAALPELTKININTVSPALLQALIPKDKMDATNAILSVRSEEGVNSQEQFNEIVQKNKLDPTILTFQSNYFLSVAIVKRGTQTFVLNTIIKREAEKTTLVNTYNAQTTHPQKGPQKWTVSIIKQTINTL